VPAKPPASSEGAAPATFQVTNPMNAAGGARPA
jgi:hypothetical protein